MNKQELIDKLASLVGSIEDFKGISTFHDGKYAGLEHALELIQQLDEPQKPVIQQFVADLVDWTNKMQCAPSDVIRDLHDNGDLANLPRDLELDKLSEYFEKAYCRYDFEKACFVGYEVEKEPLYHVKLTIPGATYYLIQTFLMPGDTHMCFSAATERYGAKWKNTFTESEIKAIDERYWPFAVPVEEVAER
ncbi:TPA: DUF1642 domain-containing protein [Enterococcus faecium]